MKQTLRIAIAQINATVGDIEGNAQKILEYVQKAKKFQADIVAFPELALCGYPPEDLLLKPSFIDENLKKIKLIASAIDGIVAIVGFADRSKGNIYNAAALMSDGKMQGVYHKTCLPNYSVFDEKRYFKEGKEPLIFRIGGIYCGINICEDIWHPEGPMRQQAKKGAGIIFALNASPYYAGKIKKRQGILNSQARKNGVYIAYTNLVGGQDELVFDGRSFIVDDKGRAISRAEAFKEDLLVADIEIRPKRHAIKNAILAAKELKKKAKTISQGRHKPLKGLDEIYQALVLGLRDYVQKN